MKAFSVDDGPRSTRNFASRPPSETTTKYALCSPPVIGDSDLPALRRLGPDGHPNSPASGQGKFPHPQTFDLRV